MSYFRKLVAEGMKDPEYRAGWREASREIYFARLSAMLQGCGLRIFNFAACVRVAFFVILCGIFGHRPEMMIKGTYPSSFLPAIQNTRCLRCRLSLRQPVYNIYER